MPYTTTPTHDELLELLRECALCISSFRRKLQSTGYVFPEPPDAGRILFDIDAICFPDALVDARRSRAKPKLEPTPRVPLTAFFSEFTIPKL